MTGAYEGRGGWSIAGESARVGKVDTGKGLSRMSTVGRRSLRLLVDRIGRMDCSPECSASSCASFGELPRLSLTSTPFLCASPRKPLTKPTVSCAILSISLASSRSIS